ncbi:VQ protein [Dillenia turbinata]|uniref:VQ protein n=1 Tax=Dillenia turbinata TaxID=194707 RepID=A0AAN8WAN8_9MAGN
MDNNSSTPSVQQRQNRKSTKPKSKKPIKVVYISNPVSYKTSASEFRALVQQLTGQHSEFPYDPKLSPPPIARDCHVELMKKIGEDSLEEERKDNGAVFVEENGNYQMPKSWDVDLEQEEVEDVFTRQMIDNFPGSFTPCFLDDSSFC